MNDHVSEHAVPHRLLTPQHAALLLGIAPDTLAVWRSTGRYDLPFVKVGRKVMYHREDIQSFIEQRTRTHTDWVDGNDGRSES